MYQQNTTKTKRNESRSARSYFYLFTPPSRVYVSVSLSDLSVCHIAPNVRIENSSPHNESRSHCHISVCIGIGGYGVVWSDLSYLQQQQRATANNSPCFLWTDSNCECHTTLHSLCNFICSIPRHVWVQKRTNESRVRTLHCCHTFINVEFSCMVAILHFDLSQGPVKLTVTLSPANRKHGKSISGDRHGDHMHTHTYHT